MAAEQKVSWPISILKDMICGRLGADEIREIQSKPKDEDVFVKILEIEQKRVNWKEKIVVPLQEHLYVVVKSGELVVKCSCGYEFGDSRQNWKLNALVYERSPEDGEVYVGPRAFDEKWIILREFYCPGCGIQLEVELVPHGYPFIFDAQLDIDGFFKERPELKDKVFGGNK